jgi:hypothetical protein
MVRALRGGALRVYTDGQRSRQAPLLEDQPGICGEKTGRFRAALNWPAQPLVDFSNISPSFSLLRD